MVRKNKYVVEPVRDYQYIRFVESSGKVLIIDLSLANKTNNFLFAKFKNKKFFKRATGEFK